MKIISSTNIHAYLRIDIILRQILTCHRRILLRKFGWAELARDGRLLVAVHLVCIIWVNEAPDDGESVKRNVTPAAIAAVWASVMAHVHQILQAKQTEPMAAGKQQWSLIRAIEIAVADTTLREQS